MTVSSQQNLQNAINRYSEAAQRWHNDLARYRCTFAEDYCRGAVAIVYEIKVAAERRLESEGLIQEGALLGGESLALLVFHHQTSQLINLQLGNQQPMLIRNVELVKLVEGFALPSFVRLYGVQEFVRDSSEGAEFQSAIDKSFQLCPGWIDRELGPVFVFAGEMGGSDPIPSVVKGRMQVVESIAQNQSEAIWQGLNRNDLDKLIARFRIGLNGDSVSTFVAAEETGGLSIEIVDVLIGPTNFQTGFSECVNH